MGGLIKGEGREGIERYFDKCHLNPHILISLPRDSTFCGDAPLMIQVAGKKAQAHCTAGDTERGGSLEEEKKDRRGGAGQGRVEGRRRRSKEGGRQATPALTTETHKAA